MSNDIFDYNNDGKIDITEQQIQAKVYMDSYNKNKVNNHSNTHKNIFVEAEEKKDNSLYICMGIGVVLANIAPGITALITIPFIIYLILKWCFS